MFPPEGPEGSHRRTGRAKEGIGATAFASLAEAPSSFFPSSHFLERGISLTMQLSVPSLNREIERFVGKTSLFQRTRDLRTQVSDSPTQYLEYPKYDVTRLVLGTRKKGDLLRLSILSWYIPDEAVRVLLQLSIREIWEKQERYSVTREIILSSKIFCLSWILKESGWTPSTFFGNILNLKETERTISRLKFFENSRRHVRRYTGYCRGYRDSSRRVCSSLKLEDLPVKSTILQEEARRLEFQVKLDTTFSRLESWLKEQGIAS